MGQAYFAVQTRRQKIADELDLMVPPEDQKRLVLRSMLSTFNARLQEAAQQSGVIEPQDFATFYDHGYMGLYDVLRENDNMPARAQLKSKRYQTTWAARSWARISPVRLGQMQNSGATRCKRKSKPTLPTSRTNITQAVMKCKEKCK